MNNRFILAVFVFGVVLGGMIGGGIALHYCTVRMEKGMADRDAAIRRSIYENFALTPADREGANSLNPWELLAAAGGAYRHAAADAEFCHAQLGVRPPDPAATPAPAAASTNGDPAVDLLNALRPGLGTAVQKLSQAHQ